MDTPEVYHKRSRNPTGAPAGWCERSLMTSPCRNPKDSDKGCRQPSAGNITRIWKLRTRSRSGSAWISAVANADHNGK